MSRVAPREGVQPPPRDQSEQRKPIAELTGATGSVPTVWVCIAVFNRVEYTRRCLELLRQQTYPSVRTVLVDDGSTDGTSEMIRSQHPEVSLLRGDGSLYWTTAMHMGVAHIVAQAGSRDYVLLLNDDLVFSPNLVDELVQTAARHPRTLVQAVESCVSDPGVIWQGGVGVNWWTAKHRRLNHLRRTSEFPAGHFERSAYLTGRGVLVPMDVFAAVGNYDTRLTQCGDGEFTRRAAKHGYQLIVSYGVSVLSYDKGRNFNETDSYTCRDAKRYYFGILSNARVSYRWRQALSMTNSTAQALVFMGFDLVRITVYFARRLRKQSLSPVR